MSVLLVGDIATVRYTLKVNGVLTDADVAPSATAPDGTISTPTLTHVSTGVWDADIPATQSGRWAYTFTASGAASDVESGTFRVLSSSSSTPLASPEDVVALYQPLNTLEAGQVDRYLRLASNKLLLKIPSVSARMIAGTLDADLVTDIVASMVVRAFRNPAGLKQHSIGPEAATYDDRAASGFIDLTAEEIALLSPVVSSAPVRSVRLAGWEDIVVGPGSY